MARKLPPLLTLTSLKQSAAKFGYTLGNKPISGLFGVTDGKAVGTYVEQAFRSELALHYTFDVGSSASGIDFPSLDVDLKVTSVRQPQSSCPFQSAAQKVYGLGYHLLVFVYDKSDVPELQAARLTIRAAVFIDRQHTADYQTTRGVREILGRGGNQDDLVAFLEERHLPLDEIGRVQLAERILHAPPEQGYLTISPALQWRLQYGRVVELAIQGTIQGVESLLAER